MLSAAPLRPASRIESMKRVDRVLLADDAEQRDQHEQRREQREDRVVGERGGPVGQVVVLELLDRALEQLLPVAPVEVGRVVGGAAVAAGVDLGVPRSLMSSWRVPVRQRGYTFPGAMKFLFLPFSIIGGLIAGSVGKKLFEPIWGADRRRGAAGLEAPRRHAGEDADRRGASRGRSSGVTRKLVDHQARKAFAGALGHLAGRGTPRARVSSAAP